MNKNDIMNILKEAVPCVFISAQEPLAELTDYGVVTGYSIIGTGPISEFFASVTDFFGMQSGCFGDKRMSGMFFDFKRCGNLVP